MSSREGLEELEKVRGEAPLRTWNEKKPSHPAPWDGRTNQPKLIAQYADESRVSTDVAGADGLILPLHTPSERLAYWQAKLPTAVAVPRGMFGREEEILQSLKEAANVGVQYALCGNIGAVDLAKQAGLRPVGGL